MPRSSPILAIPTVVAVTLMLDQYVSSAGHPSEMLRPLTVVITAAVLLTTVAFAVTRRPLGAAWLGSTAAAWLLGAQLTWFALLFGGLLVLAVQAWRWRIGAGWLRIPSTILSAPALVLAGMTSVSFVTEGIVSIEDFNLGPQSTSASVDAGRPSIYVLLLDGYPRADELAALGYDNKPFLGALGDLGIDVAPEASARFDRTELTLASMMGVEAVELGQYVGGDFPELYATWRHLRRTYLVDLPLMDVLREAGYRLEYIPSEVGHSEWRGWDVTHDSGQLTDTEARIIQLSPLRNLLDGWVMDQLRSRADSTLTTLDALARQERQKVVFAHLTPPHVPFLWAAGGAEAMPLACWYERDCSLLTPAAEELEIAHGDYADRLGWQLDALNERVVATLDGVIAADPDAVIVVLSDHGSRYEVGTDERHHTLFGVRGAGNTFDADPGPDGLFVRLLEAIDGR